MNKLKHWYSLGWLTRVQMHDAQEVMNLLEHLWDPTDSIEGEWKGSEDDEHDPLYFHVTIKHNLIEGELQVDLTDEGLTDIWVDGRLKSESLVDIIESMC